MPVFRATSSKNRWAIKSGLRWSELIGVLIALIDAEGSCRLGLTSAVASPLAAGVSTRRRRSTTSPISHHSRFPRAAGGRWFESTQLYQGNQWFVRESLLCRFPVGQLGSIWEAAPLAGGRSSRSLPAQMD